MVNKRNSLGRGLGSLLNNNQNNSLFEEININQIEINPDQPRKRFNDKSLKELSISIKNYGIIQPINVRKLSENRFQLISGERRFRASKLSGIQTIPSFIKDADEKEILEFNFSKTSKKFPSPFENNILSRIFAPSKILLLIE